LEPSSASSTCNISSSNGIETGNASDDAAFSIAIGDIGSRSPDPGARVIRPAFDRRLLSVTRSTAPGALLRRGDISINLQQIVASRRTTVNAFEPFFDFMIASNGIKLISRGDEPTLFVTPRMRP
jgi:hypothetical protein